MSALVINEAGFGDVDAAARRLALIDGIPNLAVNDAAVDLAQRLLTGAALPTKAKEDALHIAVAAVNGMDYLLTWNCAHIANASRRSLITILCEAAGFRSPVICTPEELLGDRNVD